MADGSHEAVVLLRVEEVRYGAHTLGEIGDDPDRLPRRAPARHDAVVGTLEQVRLGAVGARRLLAGHGMAANEMDVGRQYLLGPADHVALRARGVGDDSPLIDEGAGDSEDLSDGL